MPHAPDFWLRDGVVPRVLTPLSWLVAGITARRMVRPGWRAPVPVICCGNVTVGGAGKTTLVADLADRLVADHRRVHVLLRGYGGSNRATHRVAAGDAAALVGDEAKLLSRLAPTWIGADRAAGARAAVAAGAEVLLLDDGLQNPGLRKDLSLLVIDGGTGFGNGRVLPAGPLREPVAAGAARCQAAVLIGEDRTGALARLPPGLDVLRARLEQGPEIAGLVGRRVLAFAGIAVPEKFFAPLEAAGVVVAGRASFPDHHAFSERELDGLTARARDLDAILVTTLKDAVRLPPERRVAVRVVNVTLAWDDPGAIDRLLQTLPFEKGTDPP